MSQLEHNNFYTSQGCHSPLAVRPQAPPRNLIGAIARRPWIMAASLAVCLAAAAVYLANATPSYTASSRVCIQPVNPRALGDSASSNAASNFNYFRTQCELIKSTPLLSRALVAADAGKMKTFAGSPDLVEQFRQSLVVQNGSTDIIIALAMEGPYPDEAARLINAVVDSYISWTSEQKRSASTDILKILEREKQRCDAQVEARMKAVADFKSVNRTSIGDSDKANNDLLVQRLLRLSDALTTAQIETISAAAAHDAAKAMDPPPTGLKQLPQSQRNSPELIAVDSELTSLRTRLNEQQMQLSVLAGKYGRRHPTVAQAQETVDHLKTAIAEQEKQFVTTLLATTQNQLLEAQKRQQQFQTAFDQQQELTLQRVGKDNQLARLEADYKRTEKLFDSLDTRIKELTVAGDMSGLNVSVVEAAVPARLPTNPRPSRTLALGLVAGLILGSMLSLWRDGINKRFTSSQDIVSAMDLPVLGIIPATPASKCRWAVGHDPEVCEAAGTVWTAIEHGGLHAGARKLLVASAGPGQGTSSVAANLAIAMAQSGQRVLLLDSNFRRPSQHRLFGIGNDAGLSNILDEGTDWTKIVHNTNINTLDLLPSGAMPANPSAMLNGRAFAALLHQLSSHYDHIVLDSLHIADLPDARILAALCDTTLLVMRPGMATRMQAELALEGLRSVGAQAVGVVVNAVPRRRWRRGEASGWCCRYPAWLPQPDRATGAYSHPLSDYRIPPASAAA